jgi:hypothetical protein
MGADHEGRQMRKLKTAMVEADTAHKAAYWAHEPIRARFQRTGDNKAEWLASSKALADALAVWKAAHGAYVLSMPNEADEGEASSDLDQLYGKPAL